MYYGLDVHKEFIQICALSDDGKKKKEYRIPTRPDQIKIFAKQLGVHDQAVLEATFHSWSIHQILTEYSSAQIKVANAHEVHLIAKARVKTDKVDAHILAQLLRAGFIPEVKMPSQEAWVIRQLISHRRFLGKKRTATKNTIWGILNKKLIECPHSRLFTKKAKNWLNGINLDPINRFMLNQSLRLLEEIEAMIAAVDIELTEIARKKPEIELLMTIPGVDVTVATGLLAAIDDVNRFKQPKHLASYFGLIPSMSQSADKCYKGGITKEGNAYGRWLAIEAAQSLALSSAPIAASYHKIKQKKGHNVAVTALARKLIVLVWHMLKKQEPYRYAPAARTREKLRRLKPELPARDRAWVAKRPIEQIYQEAGVALPKPASAAEAKAARANKIKITRIRKQKSKDYLSAEK